MIFSENRFPLPDHALPAPSGIKVLNITAYGLSVWVLPLVIAITFHEAAHGFVAHYCGDDTAWKPQAGSASTRCGISIPSAP